MSAIAAADNSMSLYPAGLSGDGAVDYVNLLHFEGWEKSEFLDPERILDSAPYVKIRIAIPDDYTAQHPPVVTDYRALESEFPPPIFDKMGYVIDGMHRLAANAGKSIDVYVSSKMPSDCAVFSRRFTHAPRARVISKNIPSP